MTRLPLPNFFNAQNTTRSNDNTMTIYTSADGAAGSQVSVYKSALLSALTVKQNRDLAGTDVDTTSSWNAVKGSWAANLAPDDNAWVTFAADNIGDTLAGYDLCWGYYPGTGEYCLPACTERRVRIQAGI